MSALIFTPSNEAMPSFRLLLGNKFIVADGKVGGGGRVGETKKAPVRKYWGAKDT